MGDELTQMLAELKAVKENLDPDKLATVLLSTIQRDAPPPGPVPGMTVRAPEPDEVETPDLSRLLDRRSDDVDLSEFKRLSDEVYCADLLLRSVPENRRNGLDIRESPMYQALQDQAKLVTRAMYSTYAGYGDEFVPTGWSDRLIEELRLQRRLPSLFDQVTIPRTPYEWPVEGTIGLPYLIGEPTSDTAPLVPTRTPGTSKVTFSAKDIGLRVVFSWRFNWDSIIAAEGYVRRQIAKSLTDGLETAILNGDDAATHMDTIVTASNDCRKAWDGLRRVALTQSAAYDVTTGTTAWAQADIGAIQNLMSAEAVMPPSDLVLILSAKTAIAMLGDTTNWPDFQTMDKIGAAALNVTGQVGQVYGIPVVISAYMANTQNTSGYDTGAGANSSAVLVNRRAWALATQVPAELNVVSDPETLQTRIVGHQSVDFRPWRGATSGDLKATGLGYRI